MPTATGTALPCATSIPAIEDMLIGAKKIEIRLLASRRMPLL
jgi:hypothetical protein